MSRSDIALAYFRKHEKETDKRVNEGIERYRKGTAKLRFVDKAGNALEGAEVSYHLKKHAFGFGANLFMLDEFEAPEKNEAYKDTFPSIFNLATLPFYWRDQEPEQGKPRYKADSPKIYRRPPADLCLAYCKEKEIEPKAHCLNYDHFLPAWLKGCSVDEHKKALEKRFAELSALYAKEIPSWEVTNETFNVPFARELHSTTYSAFYREPDFVKWSYRMAKKYFPHNHLIINDHTDFGCLRAPDSDFFGTRSPYYMQIERILEDSESKLDSIGFQYHCFIAKEMEERIAKTRYNPEHLFDVLDTYARLGLKLQMTEMTVSALGDSQEDEWVQAEIARNLYRIFFSHPAMEAIIYWNLVDGYAYGKLGDMTNDENRFRGGFLNFDLSPKPVFGVLKDLIKSEWHTKGTTLAKEGDAEFKGFFGEYEISVRHNGSETSHTVSLQENAENQFTIVL